MEEYFTYEGTWLHWIISNDIRKISTQKAAGDVLSYNFRTCRDRFKKNPSKEIRHGCAETAEMIEIKS